MHWRERGIFRVAGIGLLGTLLLAGCSSGTNASLKTSNERRGESLTPEASPDYESQSQRKCANISAGGLEAPEIESALGENLLINGDFSRGLEGWHASANCFQPDSSIRAPNGKPSLKIENPDSCGQSMVPDRYGRSSSFSRRTRCPHGRPNNNCTT